MSSTSYGTSISYLSCPSSLSISKYERFRFSNYVYQRNGRPVDPRDRLQLVFLQEESPLRPKTIAKATAGTAAALWVFSAVRTYDDTWSLERKKLELEIKKTQLEVEKLEREAPHRTAPDKNSSSSIVKTRVAATKRLERSTGSFRYLGLPGELARQRLNLRFSKGASSSAKLPTKFFRLLNGSEHRSIRIEDVEVKLVDEEEQ